MGLYRKDRSGSRGKSREAWNEKGPVEDEETRGGRSYSVDNQSICSRMTGWDLEMLDGDDWIWRAAGAMSLF
jgi:hypothetical protein